MEIGARNGPTKWESEMEMGALQSGISVDYSRCFIPYLFSFVPEGSDPRRNVGLISPE